MTQAQFISVLNKFNQTQRRYWNNNTTSDYLIAENGAGADGSTQQEYNDAETYAQSADVDEITDDINPNLNDAQLAGKNPCDRRPA